MDSHVLVPFGGSSLADDAVVHALGTFDCPVTVLNVVTPLDERMSEGGTLDTDGSREHTVHDRTDN